MYGYLRDLNLHKSPADPVAYRSYYCGSCRAIARYYGASKILFNNYDVAVIGIILKLNKGQNCTAKTCYYLTRKGRAECTPEWDYHASAIFLVAYAKMLDEENDGNKKRAKKLRKMLEKPLKRIYNISPLLIPKIEERMQLLFTAEDEGAGVLEQGELFAEMVTEIINLLFYPTDLMKGQLRALLKWYCLVDAIDDYEKDYKKESKNPLFSIAKKQTLAQFSAEERAELQEAVQVVLAELQTVRPNPIADKEDVMLEYYFDEWCPSVIENLLKKAGIQ